MAWETWYQYEKQTPSVNNPAATRLLITNANGAVCKSDYEVTCFAPEWATVNYFSKQVGKKDALIFRNEYFDDGASEPGSRVSTPPTQSRGTIGSDLPWSFVPNSVMTSPTMHALTIPA
jgi:hypothetical protein